ncbi:hypothetical protein [Comamonas sp. A-3]|uniref:hypothetical protein n=1 Tax=Comamonas sp. C11 TaxID=2966554 RepID=UPI0028D8B77D|nr:hypothetical protein [Comamonas thiooxydans]
MATKSIYGFWATRDLPAAEFAHLSDALRKVTELPDVKQRLETLGVLPTRESPTTFAQNIEEELKLVRC